MYKMREIRITLVAVLCTIVAAGCATAPVVSKQKTDLISGVTKIVLAPAIVECIDVKTGNPSPLDESINHDVQIALTNGFRSNLAERQVDLIEVKEIPNINTETLSNDLADTYQTIKRHYSPLSSTQEEELTWLATTTRASHIMFYRCRLYTGPGGAWNPIGGQILSSSSRLY